MLLIACTGCITINQAPKQTSTTLPSTTTTVTASSNAQQTVTIPSTGAAYIVEDANNSADPQGLRGQNYSTQDDINIKYQWDVTGTEKIISVGLVQFDLSSLNGKNIKSATLQMYVTSDSLTQAARLIDISLVTGTWNEQTVTFNNKPAWSANSITSCVVSGAGVWSSWDVTSSVAAAINNGLVSYAAGLDTMNDKSQENVLYASDKVSATAPRLIITY
jgi:hypothetical protein